MSLPWPRHDEVRVGLLTELLAVEDNEANLDLVVRLCARRPDLPGPRQVLRTVSGRLGVDKTDVLLLRAVIMVDSFGQTLPRWLESGLAADSGQLMGTFLELVASGTAPTNAARKTLRGRVIRP